MKSGYYWAVYLRYGSDSYHCKPLYFNEDENVWIEDDKQIVNMRRFDYRTHSDSYEECVEKEYKL